MSKNQKPNVEDLADDIRSLGDQLVLLQQKVKALQDESKPKWNADDSAFMIWVLGFTAGANVTRPGEENTGAEIFCRARNLYMKTFPGAGPISPGGNPS